tara:strand:+ start:5126 stop:5428 length:303 start_codon:yes stop_codon:yes gene_type:complete
MATALPLAAWGPIYLPLALLALGIEDDFLAVEPFTVFGGMVKLGIPYMFATVLFCLMVVAQVILSNTIAVSIAIPYVPEVLVALITMYFVAVAIRLLGVM